MTAVSAAATATLKTGIAVSAAVCAAFEAPDATSGALLRCPELQRRSVLQSAVTARWTAEAAKCHRDKDREENREILRPRGIAGRDGSGAWGKDGYVRSSLGGNQKCGCSGLSHSKLLPAIKFCSFALMCHLRCGKAVEAAPTQHTISLTWGISSYRAGALARI